MRKIRLKTWFIAVLLLLIISLLITSCSKTGDSQQIDIDLEEETNDKIDLEFIKETIEIRPKIVLEKEGVSIDDYYFSPDGKNFFIEKNYKEWELEYGSYYGNDLFYNKIEKIIGFDWYIKGERNLSPNVVIWLNNNEAIYIGQRKDGLHVYKLDVINNIKQDFHLFKERSPSSEYYSSSFNIEKNQIAFLFSVASGTSVYIYDVNNDNWKEVYNYYVIKPEETTMNIAYGIDGNIYFDDVMSNYEDPDNWIEYFSIKLYDAKTKEVIDYKEDSRILNTSPDNRYLVYMDIANNKTVIQDLIVDRKIEIPKSVEISWNQSANEFAYIAEDESDYVVINTIDGNNIKESKIYIGDLKETGYEVINLQYIGDIINFDFVKYTEDFKKLIDNVITYSIKR